MPIPHFESHCGITTIQQIHYNNIKHIYESKRMSIEYGSAKTNHSTWDGQRYTVQNVEPLDSPIFGHHSSTLIVHLLWAGLYIISNTLYSRPTYSINPHLIIHWRPLFLYTRQQVFCVLFSIRRRARNFERLPFHLHLWWYSPCLSVPKYSQFF